MNIGEKVKLYLDESGDTSYFLEKQTGVIAKAIDNIRRGHADPDNITLKTAFSIIGYFEGNNLYEKEILHKINFVLDSNLTSYRLAHMMVYKDEHGHEHLPIISNINVLRDGKKALLQIKIFSVLRLLNIYNELNSNQKTLNDNNYVHYSYLKKNTDESVKKEALYKKINNNNVQIENDSTIVNNVKIEIDKYNLQIQNNLLDKIIHESDEFFEYVVVDLLSKMGYMGRLGNGIHAKLSKNKTIEALINQDPLGSATIYIQAKKSNLDDYVKERDIHEFKASADSKHTSKNIFITTSRLSSSAMKEAKKLSIITVDGDQLTKLMFNYHVGIKVSEKIEFVKIDNNYFN